MIRGTVCVSFVRWAVAWSVLAVGVDVGVAETISFRRDIAPLLQEHCIACHRHDRAEGGYRVDTWEHLIEPGDTGSDPVVARKLDDSEIWLRITSDDETLRMPRDGQPLAATLLRKVRLWLEQGANYDGPRPDAPLRTILPVPQHPTPPRPYRFPMPVSGLALSPGGKELLVGGYHEVSRWLVSGAVRQHEIKNVEQRIYAIRYSPDGTLVAIAGGTPGKSGDVRVFAATDGQLQGVPLYTDQAVLDIAFDQDGSRIAAASANRSVYVLAWRDGHVTKFSEHADWVYGISWGPKFNHIVSASRDKTSKVFHVQQGLIANYQGHDGPVRAAYFDKDDQVVSVAGASLHRWTLPDAERTGDPVVLHGEVVDMVALADSWFVLAESGKAQRYSRDEMKPMGEPMQTLEQPLACSLTHDGKTLAVGAFDGQVMTFPSGNAWQASP